LGERKNRVSGTDDIRNPAVPMKKKKGARN